MVYKSVSSRNTRLRFIPLTEISDRVTGFVFFENCVREVIRAVRDARGGIIIKLEQIEHVEKITRDTFALNIESVACNKIFIVTG